MAHSFALTVACRGADRYHPRTMTWSKLSLFAAVSLSIFPFIAVSAAFAQAVPSKEVDRAFPDAHDLYLDLHQNPELSGHETQTAAKLAAKLRSLGFDVTEHIDNTGI